MTTPTTIPVGALTELIAERQRFEGWIRALDDRADSVPDHIIVRVREDYTGRLREVLARLGEHAADLQNAISELEERVATTQAAIDERDEARLEGELRAAVGEYDGERWDELRNALDSELATLGSERDALMTELQELRAIHEQAVPLEQPFVSVIPERQVPAAGASTTQPAQEPPVADSGKGGRSAAIPDERRTAGRRERAVPPAPAGGDVVQPSTEDPLGELGFLAPREPAAAEQPSEATGATDSAKTLRCQECSALNYPTEWYCERCGGELATI